MNVKDILADKGDEVEGVDHLASALDAAMQMNDRRIGSLVVIRGTTVAGIVTERDILRKVVAERRDPGTTRVKEIMSTPVAVCHRETPLEELRMIMTQKRIRRLPVVENGELQGIITIGDVLAHESDSKQMTIEYLYEYLYSPAAPPGA